MGEIKTPRGNPQISCPRSDRQPQKAGKKKALKSSREMELSATRLWLAKENERFYNELDALHVSPEDIEATAPEAWQRLSGAVASRSQAQVFEYAQREYQLLTLDPELAELEKALDVSCTEALGDELAVWEQLNSIDAGLLGVEGAAGGGCAHQVVSQRGGSASKARDKVRPWSEEEHKLFLVGLERFGKGDWRSISRQCVLMRTPVQIASHAQKYFLRQEGKAAGRSGHRVSIHDISSVEDAYPPRKRRKRARPTSQGGGSSLGGVPRENTYCYSVGFPPLDLELGETARPMPASVLTPSLAIVPKTRVQSTLQWAPVQNLVLAVAR